MLSTTITQKVASADKEYWRVYELAALFGVTPKTIWGWIKTKPEFPKVALKPSRRCSLIKDCDLRRYLVWEESQTGEA